MKNEHDRVSPTEYVLRRVSKNQCDELLDNPVQRVAFEPHVQRDQDGLSVFREEFLCSRQLAEKGPRPAEDYYVARLYVCELFQLGLTVVPTRDASSPGHAVIPQLRSATRKLTKPLQIKLAAIAGCSLSYRPTAGQPQCPRGPIQPTAGDDSPAPDAQPVSEKPGDQGGGPQ